MSLITLENLFSAWDEFKRGKLAKPDVQLFERNLEDNIFQLYEDISTKKYFHQPYHTFHLWDPKFRIISKAAVRDRVAHHLLYRYLEPIFQPTFIYHSYSCQKDKGIHQAVADLDNTLRKFSKNYMRNIWCLKLDIQRFFASVDHDILLNFLKRKVPDDEVLWLIKIIIDSYHTPGQPGVGMPIGNLTSQIFANIYLNDLDHFVKYRLKEKYYLRYADDFIFLHEDKIYLERLFVVINSFVAERLKLAIHPHKIILRKFSQGIDWLGFVLLPHHRVLRTNTKKRMFKKVARGIDLYNDSMIEDFNLNQITQSYFGLLSHGNGYKLKTELENEIWFKKIKAGLF